MTIKDDAKFCAPCKRLGFDRKAHRIVPGGAGRCDEHFREEQGWPQLTNKARQFIELCNARAKEKKA